MPQMADLNTGLVPVAPPPSPVVAVRAEQGPPVMAGTNAGMVTVRVNFALAPK